MTMPPKAPTCPIHQRPLVMFCPACRGAKGGHVMSPAKQAHLEAIAPLGLASRWGKKTPTKKTKATKKKRRTA
jgi:hypothetical protein